MFVSKFLEKLCWGINLHQFVVDDDGGSSVDNDEALGTGNDARVALLNQISDENDRGRGEEFVEIDEQGNASQFSLPDNDENDDRSNEDEEVPPSEDVHAEDPKKYKIKVNGQEKEVSIEDLIERAQKVESADQYLNEASRLYREAQGSKQQPPEGAVADEEGLSNDDLALARAIQMGSEEEAVAAIRKLKSPSLSPDDLAKTIDERLNFQEAIHKFQTDYKDILSDPILRQVALDSDAKLLAQGDKRSYYDRYQAIGNELREWVNSKVGQVKDHEKSTAEVSSEKVDRKKSAPTVPKAAGGKVQQPVEAEPEETPAQIIANMARSRGGPQWMGGKGT